MSAGGQPGEGMAFLLAQVGSQAAMGFANRVAELGLTPPLVGILRMVSANPGESQQTLADRVGLIPSRMVAFVDELEARGLIERRRNPQDRRVHALHVTDKGTETMAALATVVKEHEKDMTKGLDPEQRKQLTELLRMVADAQGLVPGVHPGYRTLRT